jgi:hypothetical protein
VRECSPEVLGPELAHELKEALETIREVLDEGLRILATPALRAAYQGNLAAESDAQGSQSQANPQSAPDAPQG